MEVRTQINQTAEALQRLGHDIIWVHSGENLPTIDILHVFVASSEHWGFCANLKHGLFQIIKKRFPLFYHRYFLLPKKLVNQIQITH